MVILFNGIPSSGKSTLGYLTHLKLEHLGYKTVYLDDEVIKRLEVKQIDTLVEFLNAPITIIVSVHWDIKARLKFWCICPFKVALKRDIAKNKKEGSGNMPTLRNFITYWKDYQSSGIKIDATRPIKKCMEQIWRELKVQNYIS